MNRLGVTRTSSYALLGIVLWVSGSKSGVHATPEVIARILAHLGRHEAAADSAHPRQAKRRRRPSPGPPQGRLPI